MSLAVRAEIKSISGLVQRSPPGKVEALRKWEDYALRRTDLLISIDLAMGYNEELTWHIKTVPELSFV